MKTNLEKPKSVSKKTKPEVSPKAVVDEMNKKIPRQGRKHVSSWGYTYTAPLQKLVSEKESSEAKPRKRRKKVEDVIPEQTNLDIHPIDEHEDWDHTKKTKVKDYWRTPENIPVEQPSLDDMTLKDIIHSPEHNEERDFLINEFGTLDPEEIERITADRLRSGDYEKVVIGTTEGITGKEFKSAPKIHPQYGNYIPEEKYRNYRSFDVLSDEAKAEWVVDGHEKETPEEILENKQAEDAHVNKRIYVNPDDYSTRKYHKSDSQRGKESNSKDEYIRNINRNEMRDQNRGFLSKLKNFFSGVQEEADDLMEKFGWNEPKK